MDESTLRTRLLTKLVGVPSVILPTVLGATALIAAWGLGIASALLSLVGACGILGGFGMAATRWFLASDRLLEETLRDMDEERRAEREREIDRLDALLQGDDDPRSERALRRLRDIYGRFRVTAEGARGRGGRNAGGQLVEIASTADRLFRSCLGSLEQSYRLWETAQHMSTDDGRRSTIDARERLLGEVEESVGHLARIADDVQAMGIADGGRTELAKIRAELDESLEVARRVEERMREFREGLDEEQPLRGA